MTLDKEIIEDYISTTISEGLSKNTWQSYERDLKQYYAFLVDVYQLKSWEDLTLDMVEHFFHALYDEGLNETSISRKMSALRRFHKQLKISRTIRYNPMEKIKLPKKRKKLPEILTLDEIEKILETPDLTTPIGIRNRAMLELFYATGMRVSELANVQLSQIHLDTYFVNVIGKGNKERITLLGEEAVSALTQYYEKVRHQFDKDLSPYVFLNRRGKPLTRQGIWKILKEIVTQAGITKNVTPHTLRHSVATHLLSNGMDLRSVQELLGHEHLVTTQIYTQIDMKKRIEDYTMAHPHAKINTPQ